MISPDTEINDGQTVRPAAGDNMPTPPESLPAGSVASMRDDFERQWSTSNLDNEANRLRQVQVSASLSEPARSLRPSMGSRAASQGAMRVSSEEKEIEVTSIVHDAARITNWRGVKSLCADHSHCARYTGQDRWTALHHACSRRCPDADVVEALLRAFPDALLQIDEKGFLPLHHACRFKAPKDVVRLLLFMFPERGTYAASRRCNRGRTPLHYAVRYDAPPGVMELLLEADSRAVLEEDRDGVSPLGLVWDKFATSFEGKKALHPLLKYFETELGEGSSSSLPAAAGKAQFDDEKKNFQSLPPTEKLKKKWNEANKLLRAAFHFPPGEDDANVGNFDTDKKNDVSLGDSKTKRKWRILHATSAVKCHLTLFQLACVLHSEQAFEIDEGDLYGSSSKSGRTALHFAAASPISGRDAKAIISVLLMLNKGAAAMPDAVDDSLPLHIIADNERKAHWVHDGIKDVYLANTSAVGKRDREGRTPLHRASSIVAHRAIAVSVGNNAAPSAGDAGSIIQHLVQLHPQAASSQDKTNRLPLHYIAEHGEGWDGDIEAVLEAYRPALRSRANAQTLNRLPLHMAAASSDAKASLIAGLVAANPRAASQADAQGKFALQIACESGRSWEAGINTIFAAYEPAVREREENDRGWLALHIAASSSNAAPGLVARLCEVYPKAASVPDHSNRYPLHIGCAAGKVWEGNLEAIFHANPTAVFEADQFGLFPFHVAAMSFALPPSSSSSPGLSRAISDSLHASSLRLRPTVLGRRAVSASVGSKRPGASSLRKLRESQQQSEQQAVEGGASSSDDAVKIDILFHLLQAEPNILKI